jgi:sulfopropanediol 3-dehydrogenase
MPLNSPCPPLPGGLPGVLLKSAAGAPSSGAGPDAPGPQDVQDIVQIMLARLRTGREAAALEDARRLDGFSGEVRVSRDALAAAAARVPEDLARAIDYAHDNIRRFAEAQRASIVPFEMELHPGLRAGQRLIPVSAAGCYVPGGRYAHIASALMTIATARAAGVPHVAAVTPPRVDPDGDEDAPPLAPAVAYAMQAAGVDDVLLLGGVQGIAAMAEGMFGLPRADILVGPGNAYVAEAKRQLFGPVGIDMFAGPTDSMVIADTTADPMRVAVDLVSQAEHGANSPVWLVTPDAALGAAVLARIPDALALLPEPNAAAARAAWEACGEVILARDREAAARIADSYGPEHLHVQARDLAWWRARLTSYGSLFLGARTTVAFGDKAAGPNHVLPTSGAARYTGGLSVHKFLKCVTWQSADAPGVDALARATARISDAEGMAGHAAAARLRLEDGQSGRGRAAG